MVIFESPHFIFTIISFGFFFGFCITGFQLYQNSKDGKKNKVRENLAAKLGSLCVILTLQAL